MTRSLCLLFAATALFAETYTLGPDSQKKAGVPQGTVTQAKWTSQIFPGTVRDYWVYVPAQYDASRPAPVMVFQDGGGFVRENGAWHAATVLDNLIAQKAIPPMIAIHRSRRVARSESEPGSAIQPQLRI